MHTEMELQPVDKVRTQRVEREPVAPVSETPPGERRRRLWPWLILVLVAAGAAAYWLVPWARHEVAQTRGRRETPRSQAIPVVTATARRGDLNIVLTGLGTVNALNTVTVRSRI